MDPRSARISLDAAISGYTINAARQLGLVESHGSLEAGKVADFLILEENPFDIEIQRLHTLSRAPSWWAESSRAVLSRRWRESASGDL